MPSAITATHRASPDAPDDLNGLLNYDDAVEDFLKDLPLDTQDNSTAAAAPAKDIDEEITIKKKRKPVPKLDADRLLSSNGIPRLRKITKSRLKFRGKGYEFSDISNLLNTYQLWLDDLFPRAKFRDALDIVEKVGHSTRLNVTRRAWLDETKPHARENSPDAVDDIMMSGALPENQVESQTHATEDDTPIFGMPTHQQFGNSDQEQASSADAPDDDELDALLAEQEPNNHPANTSASRRRGPFLEDDSDEDDLDALLDAEHSAVPEESMPSRTPVAETRPALEVEDDFADEEEAMASMDAW